MVYLALSLETWLSKKHVGAGDKCCEHWATPNKNSDIDEDKIVWPESSSCSIKAHEKKEKSSVAQDKERLSPNSSV